MGSFNSVLAASREGDATKVKELLSWGKIAGCTCDINTMKDPSDYTALMIASERGHCEVINALISVGADLNVANTNGASALICASKRGHTQVVNLLISSNADVNSATLEGNTALMWAVVKGCIETSLVLINAKAELNRVNEAGATALILAAQHDRLEIMKELLTSGANVNIPMKSGTTALILASDRGDIKMARALLVSGADVNLVDSAGWTALMRASSKGNLETVRTLLSSGALLSPTSSDGWNALSVAVQKGHVDLVKVLIAAGADANIMNDFGYSPLMRSSQKGTLEIVQALLASESVDVDAVNDAAYSAVMRSSQKGKLEATKALVLRGADVLAQNDEGKSALSYAESGDCAETRAFLRRVASTVSFYYYLFGYGFGDLTESGKVHWNELFETEDEAEQNENDEGAGDEVRVGLSGADIVEEIGAFDPHAVAVQPRSPGNNDRTDIAFSPVLDLKVETDSVARRVSYSSPNSSRKKTPRLCASSGKRLRQIGLVEVRPMSLVLSDETSVMLIIKYL